MKKKINLKYLAVFGSVAVLVFGLFLFQGSFSGNVILDLEANYHEGENLDGILKLSLSEGEFIPASSVIVFESSGQRQEFILGDIVSGESAEGEYYIQGKNISGQGMGYGLESGEVSPEFSFVFGVYSESEDETEIDVVEEAPVVEEEVKSPASDDPADPEIIEKINETEVVEDVNETEPVEEVEEIGEVVEEVVEIVEEVIEEVSVAEEEVEEEVPVAEEEVEEPEEVEVEEESVVEKVTSAVSMSFASLLGLSPVTGQVTLSLEKSVNGEVSLDNPFSYDLEDGQTAELLSGSVMDGSTVVNDDSVVFEVEDGRVRVSSNYFEGGDGFGVLEINLSTIGLNFSEGDLSISFVYNDEEIAFLSTFLEETKANETDLEEVPKLSSENLTEEERKIIVGRFGDVPIRTTISEVIDGRLIRNYKIGDYELVSSYGYALGITNSTRKQMEKDKINFLRDLAKMISEEKVVSEDVDEFLVSSSF